jgi:hypothetical protein
VEIDNRTLKLIVGVIAIGLPILTDLLTDRRIHSISESYYYTGPASVVFVGFLFSIAAFLFAYNGRTRHQMFWSKVAGISATLIALFPCDCGRVKGPGVHYAAAAVMFGVLTYFCWAFYKRSMEPTRVQYRQTQIRRVIYLGCAIGIVAAILFLCANALVHFDRGPMPQAAFYGEAIGLVAFGISWLTASRTLPVVTHPAERFSPLRPNNPPD